MLAWVVSGSYNLLYSEVDTLQHFSVWKSFKSITWARVLIFLDQYVTRLLLMTQDHYYNINIIKENEMKRT